MLSPRTPIIFDALKEQTEIEVLLCADMHAGAANFDQQKWNALERLLEAENRYILFCGDQFEFATRTSKSDVYTQTMSPSEQKRWWIEHLREYPQKIIGIIDGNHEYNRASRDADMFPLYDIAVMLGIEPRYRSEAAFVDIGVGTNIAHGRGQPYRYVGYAVHKAQNLVNYGTADCIDGIDFFVSGHTHKPQDKPLGKLCYDVRKRCVTERSIENIVCGSFLKYDSYGQRGGYRVTSQKLHRLVLDGTKKQITTIGYYLGV